MCSIQIKISRFVPFFLALCLPVLVAGARAVDIRFLGVETSNSSFYLKKGGEFEPVNVPLYQNSDYYEAETSDGDGIQLYTKVDTPEGPRFEVVVEGEIPNGAQYALGIYIIAANGQGQITFYDDDWSKFPGQSYRLINISPVVISSQVDETLLQVKPFESDIVKVEIVSPLPLVRIITVYKDGHDEWKPIYNQRTALRPSWRVTGIAVVTKGKLAKVMRIPTSGQSQGGKAELRYFSFKDTGGKNVTRPVPPADPIQ